MKICFIGKYPPIEGGVSTHTYWLARGLARRGHDVHVVTNADEVEAPFRMTMTEDDWPWYHPKFPMTGGSVTVYNVEPFSHSAMAHIPVSNPFVSKLASLATDVVRRRGCELVLAYYYEPYGVAGAIAAHWTGRPLLLKHAGSDLDRLFAVPDLATTYKGMLRRADAVITHPRLVHRFLGMGVALDRLQPDPGYGIPEEAFNPAATALDVGRLALAGAHGVAARPFDPALPTIGTYGKIGLTKGTFDLIVALGRLAHEGWNFHFLAMVGEAQGEMLRPHLHRAGLTEHSWILPLLPNWNVPRFLRACTAVCFLERDFPVAIHGPMIPREIMACGTCLVLSDEIAQKQRYRDRLTSGDNLVIIEDPKDHDALAAAVRALIADRDNTAAIGQRGMLLSRELEDHDGFIDGWERLLASHADARAAAPVGQTQPAQALASLDIVLPGLISLLRARQSGIVEDFLATLDGDGMFETGVALCDFAAARIDPAQFGDDTAPLRDALRYARARLTAAHDPPAEDVAAFPVSDRLHGQRVSPETAAQLWPVRGNSVRVEAFDYDVAALFLPTVPGIAAPEQEIDLSTLGRARLLVLFQRSPNLVMRELRIDPATQALVERCDGTVTTSALVDAFCREFGGADADADAALASRIYDALDRLYRAHVVVFGERKPGWGWSGGPR
jgi:glycosyltransferase involved in cell wall biosynthesis